MRAFACPHCTALVFYENSVCVTCGSALGFLRRPGGVAPGAFVQLTLGRDGALRWIDPDGIVWTPCANLSLASCNWLTADLGPGALCECCALTRTRPADADATALAAFARTETAKRRLMYQLDFLGLPTINRAHDPGHGLAFDLLSSTQQPVITGHANGVVTIDLAEGDDPHREALRTSFGEPYRTLLGHLRHEIGHWLWDLLIAPDPDALSGFRALFGDEHGDYAAALAAHYAGAGTHVNPVSQRWRATHISAYASAHPWEDWAETFAHFLHMSDTLQTASSFGMQVNGPQLDLDAARTAQVATTPREQYDDFAEMLDAWLSLTYALNAVNRSMGKDDLYPFVLVPGVIAKLAFVAEIVGAARIKPEPRMDE